MATMSTSLCTTGTAHGMHVFQVHQYSLLRALGVGRSVRSATFTIDGYNWAISLYPSGAASPKRFSVTLNLLAVPFMPATAEARVVFALVLVDQQTAGRTRSLLPGGRSRMFHTFLVTPMQTNPLVYCSDVDRNTLESPPYLVDDRLAIGCEITMIKDPHVSATRPWPQIEPPPPAGLSKDLGELLEAGVAADVTFHVGGEVFTAHRAVLVARSPVFKAELLGPMKENASGHVSIEDMQPAVFKAMLGFVYTDELPAMADLDVDGDDYTEMHRHLLVAADRYAMARLRQICENILCSRLDARTVKTTRALAQQHRCERLRKACEQFLFSSSSSGFQFNKRPLQTTYTDLFRAHPLRIMPATTSSCTTETAHGVHVFQVHHYSYLRSLRVGWFVRSGSFAVGGCDWAIRLYPSGAASLRHASVCVELLRSARDEVVTEVGVRLVDLATGRTRSLLPDAKPKQFRTFSTKTISPDKVLYLELDKKEFEARPYLEDDRLAIECEITTIEVPRVPENQPLPDFETMALEDFQHLGDARMAIIILQCMRGTSKEVLRAPRAGPRPHRRSPPPSSRPSTLQNDSENLLPRRVKNGVNMVVARRMDLVTGAMGSVLSKLGELLKEEYELQKGAREEVSSFSLELESAHAALCKVAEVPPDQLEEQVKIWAREVGEASYDMEDVIDTFLVRIQSSKEGTTQDSLLTRF